MDSNNRISRKIYNRYSLGKRLGKTVKSKKRIKQSVGIIGAGPAGMACAEELRKSGYQVTIYDRYDRPGGLLIYGIPNFKLEKFV